MKKIAFFSVCTGAALVACSSNTVVHVSGTPGADGGMSEVDSGPVPTGPACTVMKEGTAGLLLRGTVLGPDAVISTGEVLVDSKGIITCVDVSCASAAGAGDATVLDCTHGVISPSLINTHDHIDYSGSPPVPHGTERYDHRNDWRTGKNGHAALSPKPTATTNKATVLAAELRFVMSGATSTVSSGGQPGLLRNLASSTQLEGINIPAVRFDTFPLGDSNGVEIPSGCAYPSLPTSSDLAGGHYFPHIAEGVNASAHNELVCLSAGNANDVVQAKTSIIHSIAITATDAKLYKDRGSSVVWSARTNISLYGDTAPVTLLKEAGVPITLGTDWLPSGSMNMLRELACADSLNTNYFHNAFTDQELWKMVTSNAAAATGADAVIGQLKVGYVADIAVYANQGRAQYRAVIGASPEDVALVLRGGKVLYGDDTIVGSAGVGGDKCEQFDVCGVKKRACVSQDTAGAQTLAAVQAAAGYPLVFCGSPPDKEPSCVPYRDSYPNGTSATDRDGDGVLDADDDCADVFNPARPFDAGKQSDIDGDGKGDACDRCPLDKTDGC
ncbi:MAG: amidohydrolase family protein [Polyangiaceae bacterium]